MQEREILLQRSMLQGIEEGICNDPITRVKAG